MINPHGRRLPERRRRRLPCHTNSIVRRRRSWIFTAGTCWGDDFQETGAEFEDGVDAGFKVFIIIEFAVGGVGGGEVLVDGIDPHDEGGFLFPR